MNMKTAFRLIHDSESTFTGIAEPSDIWPLRDDDGQQQGKKTCHLACILLNMESDLRGLIDANGGNQSFYYAQFCKMHVGNDDAAPPMIINFKLPLLGPHNGESRLEPLNRCWNLLKYFRYCRQGKAPWLKAEVDGRRC